MVLYTVFVIQLIISGQLGVYGMNQNLLFEMYAVGVFLAVMAFVKHRANIGRLIKGTESKTYLSKKKKEEAAKAV